MFGEVPRPAASSTTQVARLTAVSGGSVAVGVLVHLVAGGAVPTSCLLLSSLLVLASVATGGASFCAQRSRGPWTALGVLTLGQSAMMLLLTVPSADHAAMWTLPSAVLHAAAIAGLGSLLLGTERVVDGVARLVDIVVVPAGWTARGPEPRRRPAIVASTTAIGYGVLRLRDRTLRGPPVPA